MEGRVGCGALNLRKGRWEVRVGREGGQGEQESEGRQGMFGAHLKTPGYRHRREG